LTESAVVTPHTNAAGPGRLLNRTAGFAANLNLKAGQVLILGPPSSFPRSGSILQLRLPVPTGAVHTAEDPAAFFNAVADNPAPTVRTLGRKSVNRTLEAVENVRGTSENHLEGLVVIVSANFTESHKKDESDEVRAA
jgi:hypothetical protein